MLDLEYRQGVAILQLNHGKANALDLELLEGLSTALADRPEGTRSVVLTGRERMFSAGIDLPKLLSQGTDYATELIAALDRVLESFAGLEVPSVAAINGHAIAGGFVLASACDVRLVSDAGGRLGLTELSVGVPFPPLALETVRTAIGERLTRRLVLHAELFAPREAADLGLVDEVVPAEVLMERALQVAERLGAVPTTAFQLSKRQLSAPGRLRLGALDADHQVAAGRAWTDEETREVMRLFVRQHLR